MKHSKLYSLLLVGLLLISLLAIPATAQEDGTYDGKITIGTRQMQGQTQIYELLINNKVVLRYRSAANGYSAAQRAEIILQRVKLFGSELVTKPLVTKVINGSPVVMLGDRLLITVTQEDWRANNTTGSGLAKVWAANLQEALKSGQATATAPAAPQPAAPPTNAAPSASISQQEQEMLDLVNQERAKAGLKALQMDGQVVTAARKKSQDMIDKNYFDHTSPTYGDPFTMMRNMGISFGYAGENLAGNQTVARAHEALMNSPGHRANILNPNYTHVGIGIAQGGPYGMMFTQLFISK